MESSSAERVELPTAFEEAHIDHMVDLIADMLERLMSHNDRIPLSPESLTKFHSRSVPSITVLDYLKRIVRFTHVEKACLLITLHYIDQICARNPFFILSSLTCHRFIIASITVANKALSDTLRPNNLFAKVGGIPIAELNMLEREFLAAIDWRLMCTRELLQEYYINLVRTHSAGQYTLVGGAESSSGTSSSESDIDMDSGQSRPPSPSEAPMNRRHRHQPSVHEASTILIDTTAVIPSSEISRRPTIEQNMAFAALQQSQGGSSSKSEG